MSKYDGLGYYQILGVEHTATASEIKEHYREQAKRWHPDYNKAENALEVFQKISVAYDVLSDENKRLTYDLASMAYEGENLPDIFALKIITGEDKKESTELRCIEYDTMIGMGYGYKREHHKKICNMSQAPAIMFRAGLINWLLGWWSIKGFVQNIQVIKYNLQVEKNSRASNKKLLIHNALAYQQEKKYKEAGVCAEQAKEYVAQVDEYLLDKFIKDLPLKENLIATKWNEKQLKKWQYAVPTLLVIIIGIFAAGSLLPQNKGDKSIIDYYQEVRGQRGGNSVDDMVVSKIFDIPVDIEDEKMLYHIKSGYTAKVLYGPSERFDTMTYLTDQTTVRLTGMTPDNSWYRIMLDNGDMGFVEKEYLEKGVGKHIPENSKIYKAVQ